MRIFSFKEKLAVCLLGDEFFESLPDAKNIVKQCYIPIVSFGQWTILIFRCCQKKDFLFKKTKEPAWLRSLASTGSANPVL